MARTLPGAVPSLVEHRLQGARASVVVVPQAPERRLSSSHWLTGKSHELFLDVIDTLPAFILKRKGDLLSSNFSFCNFIYFWLCWVFVAAWDCL